METTFIHWSIDPEIFNLFGLISVHGMDMPATAMCGRAYIARVTDGPHFVGCVAYTIQLPKDGDQNERLRCKFLEKPVPAGGCTHSAGGRI